MTSVASDPFYFCTYRVYCQPAGLQARSLKELVQAIGAAPDESLWYHQHYAYVHYRFDGPRFRNDFSVWVRDTWGLEVLSERLSAIDNRHVFDVQEVRDRLRGMLYDWHRHEGKDHFEDSVDEPRAFRVIKPCRVLLSTGLSACTLEEFAQTLRRVPAQSVFYHTFEARLKAPDHSNDFSRWIDGALKLPNLGREIQLINPFFYTIDDYREQILNRIRAYV